MAVSPKHPQQAAGLDVPDGGLTEHIASSQLPTVWPEGQGQTQAVEPPQTGDQATTLGVPDGNPVRQVRVSEPAAIRRMAETPGQTALIEYLPPRERAPDLNTAIFAHGGQEVANRPKSSPKREATKNSGVPGSAVFISPRACSKSAS